MYHFSYFLRTQRERQRVKKTNFFFSLYIYHLPKNPNKETKTLFSSYIKQLKNFLKICVLDNINNE
jgi:hypothetical protein